MAIGAVGLRAVGGRGAGLLAAARFGGCAASAARSPPRPASCAACFRPFRARGVKTPALPRARWCVWVGGGALRLCARAAFAAGALCGGCVLCGSSGGLFRLLVPRRSCASAEAALVRSGALRAPRGSRCADVAGAAPLRSARPLVGRTGDQRPSGARRRENPPYPPQVHRTNRLRLGLRVGPAAASHPLPGRQRQHIPSPCNHPFLLYRTFVRQSSEKNLSRTLVCPTKV